MQYNIIFKRLTAMRSNIVVNNVVIGHNGNVTSLCILRNRRVLRLMLVQTGFTDPFSIEKQNDHYLPSLINKFL